MKNARRSGFTLTETVVALALIAVVMNTATRLIYAAISAGHAEAVAQADAAAVDHAVSTLRHDVLRATTVAANAGGVSLGNVVWTTDDRTLVRAERGHATRFGPLPEKPLFGVVNGRVRLAVGATAWTLRSIVEGDAQ